ncbi:MAG: NADH-dependent [FeFe] hydrogenase, group A6 [Spirochaetia bacterium]
MNKVHVTIDGIDIEVEENASVLQAASEAGIDIPTLCYHEDLSPRGSCGLCVVEIQGMPSLKRSCVTQVQEGMVIKTNTPEIRSVRRGIIELVLATHPEDCLKCIRHGKCELQDLAERFEVRSLRYDKSTRGLAVDRTSHSVVRDMNKCIGCGRCVEVCNEIQEVGSIFFQGRGSQTIVAPAGGLWMGESVCINCGQCIAFCPVGALYEKEVVDEVWEAIEDPGKRVVTQIAPAVRVALGEEFGMAPGDLVIGKLYTALKRLGIDTVFDTNFSADLTIMEEGTEFLNRLDKGGPFPLVTSCSPGWIKFGETFFPELIENISSCKSPQQMLGALIKTHYAETKNIDPGSIVSLSIMPCTAKKYEAARPEMEDSGYRDVDFVLTTRELARMIKQAGIRFEDLPESEPDPVMSEYTGAATIFGASGGVMEAALRTAYEIKTGEPLPSLDLHMVRGMKGVKEAEIPVGDAVLKVAVVSGLSNAQKLLEKVRNEKSKGNIPYHFIEIMACPGGCIGGGGQPIPNNFGNRQKRIDGLYVEDSSLAVRKSHENKEVTALYSAYLGRPGGEKSHHLLHTHYKTRNPYSYKKDSPVKPVHTSD